MARTKSPGKRKRKTKKSASTNKAGCLLAIVVLALIAVGLYLYNEQYRPAPPVTATTTQSAPSPARPSGSASSTAYEALDIALSITPRQEQLIRHIGYTVSYNRELRLPNWVGYELTRQETRGAEERSDRFVADPLAQGPIAANSDYTRSGYDKGHLAPAADMKWGTEVMKESFYFTNICPQHPELNRRQWKVLEDKIRDWAVADSAIIIVCGPVMEKQPRTIGKNKVTIPQRFFKVILSPYIESPKAIGFLFDNERAVDPLCTYVVTVDSIERLTGLDFFAPLPDDLEDRIEATANCSQWGL